MFKWLSRKLTRNYHEVPLFIVTFNLNKFKKDGTQNSCELKLHPDFRNDKHIRQTLNNLVDYIRENYDMENISK